MIEGQEGVSWSSELRSPAPARRAGIELGLGAGWNVREHEAYGFPFPDLGERMEILEEQLEIIHRQWTEEEFSFEGRHYKRPGR
jgi:alkanesulfonate monooxygenase SsuD/methylene tetrahydromethanopterin reductase-like flavin-dependent oxidoreductase (luciferase family)